MFFSIHQALELIGACSRVELPRVVARETVKEDGPVVKRCVRGTGVWAWGAGDITLQSKKIFLLIFVCI